MAALMGGGVNLLGTIVLILGLLASLGGGVALFFHEHDARLLAVVAAKQATLMAAEKEAQSGRVIGGLIASAAEAEARAANTATIKEVIHAAPITTACAQSPAVRAALDGLRGQSSGNAGAPPKAPAGHVDVQGPAASPR